MPEGTGQPGRGRPLTYEAPAVRRHSWAAVRDTTRLGRMNRAFPTHGPACTCGASGADGAA
jgi:hypothetical protein